MSATRLAFGCRNTDRRKSLIVAGRGQYTCSATCGKLLKALPDHREEECWMEKSLMRLDGSYRTALPRAKPIRKVDPGGRIDLTMRVRPRTSGRQWKLLLADAISGPSSQRKYLSRRDLEE